MKKINFLLFNMLLLALGITATIFNSCHNYEDQDRIAPSSFSGIVTYNGTPIQSAEVAIYVNFMHYQDRPLQKTFTDNNGRYEMVAEMNGGYSRQGQGQFYCMWVKYSNNYYDKCDFAVVLGQHHTVNIPLDKW